jgi:hypothetical protein
MTNAEVNIILSNSYFVQGVIKKINGTFLIYNLTINYKENKEHPRNIYICIYTKSYENQLTCYST